MTGVKSFTSTKWAVCNEYWLVDPDREQAGFYRLDARSIYQLVPLEDEV